MKQNKDDQDTMHTLSPLEQGLSTHALYAITICYNEPTGKLYTNLMGQFPVQSSRGHKYILVAYNFDSNSIHVKPLKSRHDNDTIKAYEEIYNTFTWRGLKPRLHWLDNEASKALKTSLTRSRLNTNLHHHTSTDAMQLNVPYAHSRTTSSVVYAWLTKISPYIYGATYWTKWNSP